MQSTATNRGCRNKNQFTADSKLHCEECDTDVHVGTGGMSNLNAHQGSKTCKENKAANALAPQKKEKSLFSFFSRKTVQQNTPRVTSPPLVHATPFLPESICHPSVAPASDCQDAVAGADQPLSCPSAVKLMEKLKAKIEAMPKDIVPTAQLDHPLAAFLGDPANCILGGFEDDWEEVLNPRMKQAFGWGEDSDRVERDFAQRGEMGLDGFLKFVGYFVDHRGLLGALIETKVMILLDAITKKYVSKIRNAVERN